VLASHSCAIAEETGRFASVVHRDDDGKLVKSESEIEVGIILPPVDPPAIYCVGLNYLDHAKEVKMDPPQRPITFLKATTAAAGHLTHIVIPEVCQSPPEVDYEAELAVVIGREATNVSEEEAMDYVLGYSCANDVTGRRWQGKKGGGQWSRSKSFDTFAPIGPYVVPKSLVPNPHDLRIRTILNGKVVQDGNTKNMIFTIPELISFLSQGTTLLPGTIILTGTPAGVGYTQDPPLYLKRGDVVEVEIEGIGKLTNHVAEERGDGVISDAGVRMNL